MSRIRVAIAGCGNCASSFYQGLDYYSQPQGQDGLIRDSIGGFVAGDIEVVAAFDIDSRKVGQPLGTALRQLPNCTPQFSRDLSGHGPLVQLAPQLDGVAEHMTSYPDSQTFLPASGTPVDVAKVLKESGAEILINYLPVGSEQAAFHYAEACLATGVSMINCIPVFIASKTEWAERFRAAGIPMIGDDIKSQLGATIVHRTLTQLFQERGITIKRSYQLNTGGNTDFLNMLNQDRLASKRISKTEAVSSAISQEEPADLHIGPSDYVPFLKDNKNCFLRIEGEGFAGQPIELELKLSVMDSPNSAGVVMDAVRYIKIARELKLTGPLIGPSAYLMKRPPVQLPLDEARGSIEELISQYTDRPVVAK